MTENSLKMAIIDYLVMTLDAVVVRVNSGGNGGEYIDKTGRTKTRWFNFSRWFAGGVTRQDGEAGISDLLVYLPADPVAIPLVIETKVGNNKPTPGQLKFQAECRKRGIPVCVAYSLDDVIQKVAELNGRP
jgi:hypothetical protein